MLALIHTPSLSPLRSPSPCHDQVGAFLASGDEIQVELGFWAGLERFVADGFKLGDPADHLHPPGHPHAYQPQFSPPCPGCFPPLWIEKRGSAHVESIDQILLAGDLCGPTQRAPDTGRWLRRGQRLSWAMRHSHGIGRWLWRGLRRRRLWRGVWQPPSRADEASHLGRKELRRRSAERRQ